MWRGYLIVRVNNLYIDEINIMLKIQNYLQPENSECTIILIIKV